MDVQNRSIGRCSSQEDAFTARRMGFSYPLVGLHNSQPNLLVQRDPFGTSCAAGMSFYSARAILRRPLAPLHCLAPTRPQNILMIVGALRHSVDRPFSRCFRRKSRNRRLLHGIRALLVKLPGKGRPHFMESAEKHLGSGGRTVGVRVPKSNRGIGVGASRRKFYTRHF